eukprot:3804160-Prorocentrum_lima.AAC.1
MLRSSIVHHRIFISSCLGNRSSGCRPALTRLLDSARYPQRTLPRTSMSRSGTWPRPATCPSGAVGAWW